MSRHELVPLPGCEDLLIVVGNDRPLGSLFAIVKHTASDEDGPDEDLEPMVWIGTSPHEITDPQHIIDAVRPWAVVPDDLADTLTADRDREGSPRRTAAIDHLLASIVPGLENRP